MTPEDKKKRGEALLKRRKAMKASRAAIAAITGFDPSTIQRMDKGHGTMASYDAYEEAVEEYNRVRAGDEPRTPGATTARHIGEAMEQGPEVDGFLTMMDAAAKSGAPMQAIEAMVRKRAEFPNERRVGYWALIFAQALTAASRR